MPRYNTPKLRSGGSHQSDHFLINTISTAITIGDNLPATRLQRASNARMAPAAVSNGGSNEAVAKMSSASKDFVSIEERFFTAALVCLEGHYTDSPPMGPKTHAKVIGMISKSLEKTHASKDVR